MSTIKFNCHACNQVLRVSSAHAGKRAKCNKCGTGITIPSIPVAEVEFIQPNPPPPLPMAAPGAGPGRRPIQDEEEDDRPRRRRRDEDDYDDEPRSRRRRDDEDDYDRPRRRDEDLDHAPPPKPAWIQVRLGYLLAIIGLWVFLGGYGLQQIAMLFATIMTLGAGFSPTLANLIRIFMMLGSIVILGSMVCSLVGYVFFIFIKSNKHAALGFAITTLAMAAVSFIMFVVFKLIPLFDSTGMRSMMMLGSWGYVILEIFNMLLMFGTFLMQGLFVISTAKLLKERRLTGFFPVVLASVLCGYSTVATLLVRILVEVSRGPAMGYLALGLQWLMVPLVVGVLVTLVLRSMAVRRAI